MFDLSLHNESHFEFVNFVLVNVLGQLQINNTLHFEWMNAVVVVAVDDVVLRTITHEQ